MAKAPVVKLNNGYEMPAFALGTYTSLNGAAERSVRDAIDAGYRHIDTAYVYLNEDEVGRGVQAKIDEGVIKREDMFLTTKLWNTFHLPSRVEAACRRSLANLGVDYIDLYLMHWPIGFAFVSQKELLPKNEKGLFKTSDIDYLETYKAMEDLVKLGLVRSIGVSNFNHEQLTRLLKVAQIKPVVNQIELCPNLVQHKLVKFCLDSGIQVMAFCPLGRPNVQEKRPDFFFDDRIKALGEKYNKSPAQITLRYIIQVGATPLPKSTTKERIIENIEIFDFELTEDEMNLLDSFDCQNRISPLGPASTHKYYPFNIKYND